MCAGCMAGYWPGAAQYTAKRSSNLPWAVVVSCVESLDACMHGRGRLLTGQAGQLDQPKMAWHDHYHHRDCTAAEHAGRQACPLPGPQQYLQCLRIADRCSQQADMNALHGTYTAGRGTCIHKGLEIVHRCLAACAVSALLAMMTSAELPAALDHLDCRAGHTCPSLWYWLMQLQQGSCTSPGSLSMPLSAAIALQQAER